MKPFKPLIMKTYGKQMRKVSPWFSPENRKRAFESSGASDDHSSVFEPSKPLTRQKTNRVSVTDRVGRPAKRKAMLCLVKKSLNEESSSSSSFDSTQKSETIRHNCPPKRKGKVSKSKTSSDENTKRPPTSHTTQQRKDTSYRQKTNRVSVTGRVGHPAKRKAILCLVKKSFSEEFSSSYSFDSTQKSETIRHDCPPKRKGMISKSKTSDHLPSVGRFVTRCRRTVTAKSKHPKASLNLVNSSNDFTSGDLSCRRVLKPSRKRKVIAALVSSSTEKLGNLSGISSCAPKSLKEISANMLPDHTFGSCPRKPIFCSTPSAGHFTHRSGLKSIAVNRTSDQLDSPTSLSVSCISVLNPFQQELDSLGQSPLLFSKCSNKTRSWSEEAKKHSVDTENKNGEASDVNLFSTEDFESNSQFLSATGKLHWLTEALKEKCMNVPCNVQLERLYKPAVSQFSGQTTYSSCLGHSGVGHSHQTSESFPFHVSVNCNTTNASLQSGYSHSMSTPPSKKPKGPSKSVLNVIPEIGDNLLPAATLKEDCLTRKCFIKITRSVQSRCGSRITHPEVLDSYSDDQIKNHLQSDSHSDEDTCTSRAALKKNGSTNSEYMIMSDQDNIPQKGKKSSQALRDKKKTTSTDRSGTFRKVCVSGLSVNRWKNNNSGIQAGKNRSINCSISEIIPAESRNQSQKKMVFGSSIHFSTPLRVNRLNLSSLLADFTPNTRTWSRIKAVLSVHRKGMVLQTPRSSDRWMLDISRRGLADISQDLFATPFSTPIAKRLSSQLLHNSPLVECADGDLSDAEKVYAECGQQCPLPWEECILPHCMKQCVKIGEGTFGEVFSVTNASGETVALKVIPIEGNKQVNGEDQKTFGEILHEVIISKELSQLKEKEQNQTNGFIGLNDLHCVQGCYPPDFMEAWDTFDKKRCSENDRPDFFENDQIFLILEFEFGGTDLENSNGTLSSLGVAKSILHQVTAALAVAEQELHFEHRDLHWGNLLVKPTKEKKGSFLLNGVVHFVENRGVLVRIIDYSLSRLEIDDLTVSCDISNDEELFMGKGDYQFDIYRVMRKENGNVWTTYQPHTNVLWLHYLCSKLLSMKYRSMREKGVKEMKRALTHFSNNALQYSSATDVLQNCSIFQE